MHLLDDNDMPNQQRLHDLLRRAYFMDYGRPGVSPHQLAPAIEAEINDFRQRAQTSPSLALAVAMAEYHFAWYRPGTAEMDVEVVEDAANHMYASIQFSACDRVDMPMDMFFQRMCNSRWAYAVLLYSELGREFAARYITDKAATILEKAIAVFDDMKRLPYFAQFTHWQSPYDINLNEEWFPGASPSGPIWDKAIVPLAGVLEANAQVVAAELSSIVERGLFDQLHFEGVTAEGQDAAPLDGRIAVELSAGSAVGDNAWATAACREAPRTCALLAQRPELQGCQHASAAFVRLRPSGRLKPYYGASPKLSVHLAVQADPGCRMSVGKETVAWRTGEAIVYDDTFIRQEWHAGVKGEQYVLQVSFCHPCTESQRSLYAGRVVCPQAPGMAAQAASTPGAGESVVSMPFAAAALWAASLPDLALCHQVGETCPPDSQHGGPNPLSALNTWNYAINNLRAALRHARVEVDPQLTTAMAQVLAAIRNFLAYPALEDFAAIVTTARVIFEAMQPWLSQQPPAQVRLGQHANRAHPPAVRVPSDGKTPISDAHFTLANGVRMPAIGFGTWKLEGEACYNAVRWALELGVRHIDTAEAYGNEADVGRAVADSGVPRDQLFIATKSTSVALGMAGTSYLQAIFAGQLQALRTEYVDVYMLHAAGLRGQDLVAAWREMEALHEAGRIRALGVANFGVADLEELWAVATHKPVYLQNIYKVYKPGEQILSAGGVNPVHWAQRHGMVAVGYSVINSWPHLLPPLEDPHVLGIAQVHGKTPSQVLHRWCLQHGVAVIPKASSRDRIRENSMVLDFELSPSEIVALDGLASLSESTQDAALPAWLGDTFGIFGRDPSQLAAPAVPAAGQASFAEAMRGGECSGDLAAVRSEPFSMGGGSHELSECQAACVARGPASCSYVTFYHSTGYCHFYKACPEQRPAGDGAVIYARMS